MHYQNPQRKKVWNQVPGPPKIRSNSAGLIPNHIVGFVSFLVSQLSRWGWESWCVCVCVFSLLALLIGLRSARIFFQGLRSTPQSAYKMAFRWWANGVQRLYVGCVFIWWTFYLTSKWVMHLYFKARNISSDLTSAHFLSASPFISKVWKEFSLNIPNKCNMNAKNLIDNKCICKLQMRY